MASINAMYKCLIVQLCPNGPSGCTERGDQASRTERSARRHVDRIPETSAMRLRQTFRSDPGPAPF
jgi:hypothetical protein